MSNTRSTDVGRLLNFRCNEKSTLHMKTEDGSLKVGNVPPSLPTPTLKSPSQLSCASGEWLEGFDKRYGLDRFDPKLVRELGEEARQIASKLAEGQQRLAAYLAAPPEVQAEFDRRHAVAAASHAEEERLEMDEYEAITELRFERWLVEQDES